jgi:hypothetical protein
MPTPTTSERLAPIVASAVSIMLAARSSTGFSVVGVHVEPSAGLEHDLVPDIGDRDPDMAPADIDADGQAGLAGEPDHPSRPATAGPLRAPGRRWPRSRRGPRGRPPGELGSDPGAVSSVIVVETVGLDRWVARASWARVDGPRARSASATLRAFPLRPPGPEVNRAHGEGS